MIVIENSFLGIGVVHAQIIVVDGLRSRTYHCAQYRNIPGLLVTDAASSRVLLNTSTWSYRTVTSFGRAILVLGPFVGTDEIFRLVNGPIEERERFSHQERGLFDTAAQFLREMEPN